MAISAFLTVAPSTPDHGDTVTATYTITGNDPIPPTGATVTGEVVVAGTEYDVSTTITLPGTPAPVPEYEVPTCPGLTFAGTDDPAVFTAVVP